MPENWKTYKLGDIASFSQGIQVPTQNQKKEFFPGCVRFIRIVDFTKGDINEIRFIPNPGERYIVQADDLVMIRYGSQTAGKIARGFTGAIANNTFKISVEDKVIDKNFLYFYLSSERVRQYFNNSQSSSTMPAITFGMIESLSLEIPLLQEQKSIASILSAIDDKIELNLQMNKTLEEMAMALYKHWFVDFGPFQDGEFVESELGEIPEGWKVKKMEDIISVKDGTHDSPKRTDEGYHLITSKHIKTNEIDFSTSYKISEKDYHKINQRSKVDKDDILMTMIGTVGLFHLVNNEPNYAIKNIGLFKTSEKKEMKNFMFLFFKSQYSTQYIQSQLAGSTQQYLTLKVLRAFPVLLPPQKELLNFNIEIDKLLKLIEVNSCENQTLTQLRDTLLPKLISGEVRIKDAEKTLSEVL